MERQRRRKRETLREGREEVKGENQMNETRRIEVMTLCI